DTRNYITIVRDVVLKISALGYFAWRPPRAKAMMKLQRILRLGRLLSTASMMSCPPPIVCSCQNGRPKQTHEWERKRPHKHQPALESSTFVTSQRCRNTAVFTGASPPRSLSQAVRISSVSHFMRARAALVSRP